MSYIYNHKQINISILNTKYKHKGVFSRPVPCGWSLLSSVSYMRDLHDTRQLLLLRHPRYGRFVINDEAIIIPADLKTGEGWWVVPFLLPNGAGELTS